MEIATEQEVELYENLIELVGETENLICVLHAWKRGGFSCVGSEEAVQNFFHRMESHITQYTQDICGISCRLLRKALEK